MERALFSNRADAGRQLADVLLEVGIENPVLCPILRGGLEVAEVIAQRIHAPICPLIVRKVGHPWQPELGLGAIAPDGVLTLDEEMQRRFMVTESAMQKVVEAERKELARRKALYQLNEEAYPFEGRNLVAVDDGMATGITARVVGEYLRRKGAQWTALAVPVASDQALATAAGSFDRVFCLAHDPALTAVSRWYKVFGQVTDRKIQEIVAKLSSES